MTRFDLVIFDCDGVLVLVDSESIVSHIVAETLNEAGFRITYEEVIQQFMGKSLATYLGSVDISPQPEQGTGKAENNSNNFERVCQKPAFLSTLHQLEHQR